MGHVESRMDLRGGGGGGRAGVTSSAAAVDTVTDTVALAPFLPPFFTAATPPPGPSPGLGGLQILQVYRCLPVEGKREGETKGTKTKG